MSHVTAFLRGLVLTIAVVPGLTRAETPEFQLTIKGHLFYPAELVVPANVKFKLMVANEDATPEEFESYELNREKVVLGNGRTSIFIGPLLPGEYPFFGEFNSSTAQGKIIAR
jgi:hypothetical protein